MIPTKQTWDAVWQNSRSLKPSRLVEEVDREQRTQRCQRILNFIKAQGFNITKFSVIEVGCGSAIYSCIMARHGAVVTALDQSEEALARAMERAMAVEITLETVKGEALEFSKVRRGAFDMAMSFGTVEHFRPPLRYEMCRAHWELVRPGGIVVISVPNIFFLPHEILKRLLIMRGKWFLGYEGSFTPWELRRVGQQLGLRHLEMHGTNLTDDISKYWRLIKGTGLWKKVFPWWASKSENDEVQKDDFESSHGKMRCLVNRYLGHDITLMGIKEG